MSCSDKSEMPAGPSSTVASVLAPGGQHKYRLGRSFRLPKMSGSQTVAQTPPSGCPYELSDLRPDGAYVEPHSAFGYNLRSCRFVKMAQISMRYKPNYRPENTGRMQTLMSMIDYNVHRLPSYHSYEDPMLPRYGEPGRKCAFVCGIGALTPTLNHEWDPPDSTAQETGTATSAATRSSTTCAATSGCTS